MDPAVDHGDRQLHRRVVAGGRRYHLHHGALGQEDASMTTEHVCTAPVLESSRRIAAVGLLAGVLALLATPASASAGTTERVSVDSAGNQQNGSFPFCSFSRYRSSMSVEGRFVGFESDGQNLVPGVPLMRESMCISDRW